MFLVAIADGATETSFARKWANLLVHSFCDGLFTGQKILRALPRIQRLWLRSVSEKSLPWYAEEKLKEGAYSSLVGLTLHDRARAESESGEWEAIAIGDSCLFQVREGELIKAWPLDNSVQFNSRPVLLSSLPGYNAALDEQIVKVSDAWKPGDMFYLMTDALACWFLRAIEGGRKVTDIIPEFDGNSLFSEWVGERRASSLLRNDDVTFVRILLS